MIDSPNLRAFAPSREPAFSLRARLLRLSVLSLFVFCVSSASLPACSIPVFRFALERWSPDLFEVSVFYRGALNDSDQKRLDQLEDWAVHNGGSVNLEVVRCDLDERVPEDLLVLWKSLKDAALPTVIVRTPRNATGQHVVWQGQLSDPALDELAASPACRDITQRLLSGDAVVWLLVRGADQELAARTRGTFDAALQQLTDEIELPPGVGRPGSELLSKIPLRLKFSIVEVSADSRNEHMLIQLLHGNLAKPPRADESYLAPIFGRGRVLNVLSASDIEAETITDLTQYLCGACSCQVKQQNPGFDLLCAMNWEERLFDESFNHQQFASSISSEGVTESTNGSEPAMIAIPPGQKLRASNSLTEAHSRFPANGHHGLLFAMAMLAVMASGIVVAR